MQVRDRVVSVLALLGLLGGALYGGSVWGGGRAGSSDGSPSAPDDGQEKAQQALYTEEKETIHFWYGEESLTDYVNSAAVAFGQQEDIRVLPQLVTESEYLEAVNRASLEGELVPDVYLLGSDDLEKAYLAGLAIPLEDQESWQEERFPRTALDAVTCDSHGENHRLAYPLCFDTTALVYNETYLEEWARQQAMRELSGEDQEEEGSDENASFDEARLEERTRAYLENAVPETVDDILQIADTFDLPEGVEGIMSWDVSDIFYNYWFVGNYISLGGETGDQRDLVDLYNPQAVECLEVYQALHQFFYIESDTVTYDSVVEDFIQGHTVFTVGSTDVVERLRQAGEDGLLNFDYGIAPLPWVGEALESRPLSVTEGVAVNGYSRHREAAGRFAAFLTGEYGGELYGRSGWLPADTGALAGEKELQVFGQVYASSASLPKMMETGSCWLQLEVLFSRVWNGAEADALLQELDGQVRSQLSSP